MNADEVFSTETFVYMFTYVQSAIILTFVIINCIWIYALNYHPPMPYIGSINFLVFFAVVGIGFWFQHPMSMRLDLCFKKRLRWYLYMRAIRVFIIQVYMFSASLFEKVPPEFQFVLAFALPVVRYGSNLIQHKMADKAKGPIESASRFSVSCNVACNHALYLAIYIGSIATDLTACLICGIDVLLLSLIHI